MKHYLDRVDNYYDFPSFTKKEREKITKCYNKFHSKYGELTYVFTITPCGNTRHTEQMDISEVPIQSFTSNSSRAKEKHTPRKYIPNRKRWNNYYG